MPALREVMERAEAVLAPRLEQHRVEEVVARDPESLLVPARLIEPRLRGQTLRSFRRHGHWLLIRTGSGAWLGMGFGPTGELVEYEAGRLEPPTARFVLRFEDGVHLAYTEDEPLGEIGVLDPDLDDWIAREIAVEPAAAEELAPSAQLRDAKVSGEVLAHIDRTADLPRGVAPSDAFVNVSCLLLACLPESMRGRLLDELPRPLAGLGEACTDTIALIPPVTTRRLFLRHVAARLGVSLQEAERLSQVVIGEIHGFVPPADQAAFAQRLPGGVESLWRPRAEPQTT
ncbi:MAG: DNA-formamidopyrimidine glycosylase family protein [Myxococcota bacterium]